MKTRDYQHSITVNVPPHEVFVSIADVSAWWARDLKGKTSKQGDVFTVTFGETFVTFKVAEIVADQRIVWEVTDSYLHWIKNKKEWNGTRIVFEITPMKNNTRICMTHVGLVPEVECFGDCQEGWNEHFGESLLKLITEHEGMPV